MISRRFQIDLLHSPRAMIGAAAAAVSLYMMVILVITEALSGWKHPYLGILTFLLLPVIFLFGLVLTLSGVRKVRKRRTAGAGRRTSGADRTERGARS